jgi:dihydroorotate dehydrogenase electron transfer subunit
MDMPAVIKAEIVARRSLNQEEFALDLRCPEVAAAARPGQFVMLRASQAIDPITPRPISILSTIEENGSPFGITLVIKVFGRGTRALSSCKPGELLPLTGPLGNHIELDPSRTYLMVAGGTGIAPAAFAARELARAGGCFKILYGGRGKEAVHLGELGRIGLEAVPVTEDGSLGRRGMVTEAIEGELGSGAEGIVCFSCGPWAMMRRSAEICAARGIECLCSLERYMACGIGVCLSCVYRNKGEDDYHTCCQDGPVVNGLEVDWDA